MFALVGQTAIAIFVVFVVVLLMSSDVIRDEVGAPIITGVVGLVFGKGWDVAASNEVQVRSGGGGARSSA